MSKTQQIDRIITAVVYASMVMLMVIGIAAVVLLCIIAPYVLVVPIAFSILTAAFYLGGSK